MKFLKKYSLAIFCLLAVTTIFAFSKIEAASIGTITAGDNFNVNTRIGSCTVPLGSNTCVVQVNWTVYQPGQNIRVTSSSGGYPVVLVSGVIAGPYLYTASYTTNPIKFTLYNNDNDEYASEASVSLSCASGSYWNSSQAKCVASPNGDLHGYPTYTGSTCTVPEGASTCNVGMAWYTDNPLYGATSAITTPGKPTVKTGNSGNATYSLTVGEKRTFYLYHNGVLLDQQEFSGVEGARVTLSIVNASSNNEIATGYGNFTKEVGSLLKSFFGLRTIAPVPASTSIRIHWETTPENAFDVNTIECTMPDGSIVKNKLRGDYPSIAGSIPSPSSTMTYSITCIDDKTPTTTESAIPLITDASVDGCGVFQIGHPGLYYESGSAFYYHPAKNLYVTWKASNSDYCKVNSQTISKDTNGVYHWWAPASRSSPEFDLICTNSSTGEIGSVNYTIDSCYNANSSGSLCQSSCLD